jgi:glycosyltransferase involved in cell wall biosynthesis
MPAAAPITAVTAAWNRSRYLGEALESALSQVPPPAEIVVVDDGSTDDTPAVARSFGNRIRYHRQENAGAAAARTRCIALATSPWVAFLDSDDAWLPGRLARQVPLLASDPRTVLLYAAVEYMDGEGRPLRVRPSGRGRPEGDILLPLLRGNVMETVGVIARRDALLAAGPFDQRRVPVEDWDMWLKVVRRGRTIHDPVVSGRVRVHGDQLRADPDRNREAILATLEVHADLLEREDPPLGRKAARILGEFRLRRARRALQDGDRERAAREIDAAVAKAPGLRARALLLRARCALAGAGRGRKA